MTERTIKELKEIHRQCLELAARKNNDYGTAVDNISVAGLEGIAVRLFDKAARLLSLTRSAERKVKDETLEDTLKDMVNYASFGVCLLKGTWGR